MSRLRARASKWAEETRAIPAPPPPQAAPYQPLPRGTCDGCRILYGRGLFPHKPHCTRQIGVPAATGPRAVVLTNAGQPVNNAPIVVSELGKPANMQPLSLPSAPAAPAPNPKACPGCGREFPKGLHLHMRACLKVKPAV